MTAKDSSLARYLRHGRLYGTGDDLWEIAVRDLSESELRTLAGELGVNLPSKWVTRRNQRSEPAPQAGSTANKSAARPTGQTPAVSSAERPRSCRVCGHALGAMNTTGLCRTHYQRDLMRARRANAR